MGKLNQFTIRLSDKHVAMWETIAEYLKVDKQDAIRYCIEEIHNRVTKDYSISDTLDLIIRMIDLNTIETIKTNEGRKLNDFDSITKNRILNQFAVIHNKVFPENPMPTNDEDEQQ